MHRIFAPTGELGGFCFFRDNADVLWDICSHSRVDSIALGVRAMYPYHSQVCVTPLGAILDFYQVSLALYSHFEVF